MSTGINVPKEAVQQIVEQLQTTTANIVAAIGVGGFLTQAAGDLRYSQLGHNHDLVYAPIAKGVTNGDSHDHIGGDGAAIQADVTPVITVGGNNTTRTINVAMLDKNGNALTNKRLCARYWYSLALGGLAGFITGPDNPYSHSVLKGVSNIAFSTTGMNAITTDVNGEFQVQITSTNAASATNFYFHVEVAGFIIYVQSSVFRTNV